MDEPNVKELKPYDGRLFPEGSQRTNWGAHWYDGFYQLRMTQDDHGNTIGGAHFKPGHTIARKRHETVLNDYTPRFRRRHILSPKCIGEGSFGKVFQATFETIPGETFAIKVVASDKSPHEIWKERDLLIYLKHKRVINLCGAFHRASNMFFVMELCYSELTPKMADLSEENKFRFSIHMFEAVSHLHSKNIIHCDLKPANFLITSSNNLVLCDFGEAVILESGLDTVKSPRCKGKPCYQDKESNREFLYSKSSDVFSLGCIIYEIWAGSYLMRYSTPELEKHPIQEREEYAQILERGRVLKGHYSRWPFGENAPRKSLEQRITTKGVIPEWLVKEMTQSNRDDRITLDKVIETGVVRILYKEFDDGKWKLDGGTDFVLTTVLMTDLSVQYKPNCTTTIEQNAAYVGIYFDEEEMEQQKLVIPAKSILNYDSQLICNFINRHGLECILFETFGPGSSTRSAEIRRGIFQELTSSILGRKEHFPTIGDGASKDLESRGTKNVRTRQEQVAKGGGAASSLVPVVTRVPVPTSETATSDAQDIFEHSDNGFEESQDITVVPESQPQSQEQQQQQAMFSMKKLVDPQTGTLPEESAATLTEQTAPKSTTCSSTEQTPAKATETTAPASMLKTAVASTILQPIGICSPLRPKTPLTPRPPPSRRTPNILVPVGPDPPKLPPYQGGVVPDPLMVQKFFPPSTKPGVTAGVPSSSSTTPIRPFRQLPLSAAPSTLTQRGSGAPRHQFQLSSNPTFVFKTPAPVPPRGVSRQGVQSRGTDVPTNPTGTLVSILPIGTQSVSGSSPRASKSSVIQSNAPTEKLSSEESGETSKQSAVIGSICKLAKEYEEQKRRLSKPDAKGPDKEQNKDAKKRKISSADPKGVPKKKPKHGNQNSSGDDDGASTLTLHKKKSNKEKNQSSTRDDEDERRDRHRNKKSKKEKNQSSSRDDVNGGGVDNNSDLVPGFECNYCGEWFEDEKDCSRHQKRCEKRPEETKDKKKKKDGK